MSLTGPNLYITPAILINAPTGVAWSTIPTPKATSAQQLQEQQQICYRTSSWIDNYCNQPLKCTYDVETVTGPNDRMTYNRSGGFFEVKAVRFPILSVIGGSYSNSSAFPYQWTNISSSYLRPSGNVLGSDGSLAPVGTSAHPWRVQVSGQVLSTQRNGWTMQFGYLNGWPTTSLTTAANVGDTSVEVDDVTGWYLGSYPSQFAASGGAQGVLGQWYDPLNLANEQSIVTNATATTPITSFGVSVQTGPGTLTLDTPLQYAHAAGTLFTSLPYTVIQAAIYRSVYDVLIRGTTSLNVPSLQGGITHATGDASAYATEAELLLQPFIRII